MKSKRERKKKSNDYINFFGTSQKKKDANKQFVRETRNMSKYFFKLINNDLSGDIFNLTLRICLYKND